MAQRIKTRIKFRFMSMFTPSMKPDDFDFIEKKKEKVKEEPVKKLLKGKQEKVYKELSKKCTTVEAEVSTNEEKVRNTSQPYILPTSTTSKLHSKDIHQMAGDGKFNQVKRMLQNGFQVDALDEERNTPLIYACHHGHFQTTVLLIKSGANVNHQSKHGYTPLMFACWGGHFEIASLLIKHHANVKTRNVNRDTALHFAALGGHPMMCLLLRREGADANARNAKNKTPSDHMKTHVAELEAAIQVKLRKEVDFIRSKKLIGLHKVSEEYCQFMSR
ncbi:ankyrin repeat domain-containing protein 27-like [Clytia hemisphaerica]|uniref:Uncharacterized protein n=1 Tax=Clytia hemisphaerica TaxID=252671 RepID=A0A7M5VFA8_9CNID